MSEATVAETEAALKIAPIVPVQNLYNLVQRDAEQLLDWAIARGMGFIPWFPLATGVLTGKTSLLINLAAEHDASPAQLALTWLLKRSPVVPSHPGNLKHRPP